MESKEWVSEMVKRTGMEHRSLCVTNSQDVACSELLRIWSITRIIVRHRVQKGEDARQMQTDCASGAAMARELSRSIVEAMAKRLEEPPP